MNVLRLICYDYLENAVPESFKEACNGESAQGPMQ